MRVGLDGLQGRFFGLAGEVQVPAQLQVHPEIGRHAEKFRQP